MGLHLKKRALAVSAAILLNLSGQAIAKDREIVVVSWGGAYTDSQQKAYHKPYMDNNPGIKIINDDSSAEGLAKLRAQVEADNVTWALIDMMPSDAIIACDEGLIEEVNYNEMLAAAPDGTKAREDFGETIVSDCFIPQVIYSTTFGYRSDKFKGDSPSTIADIFDLEKFPGKRALEKRPVNNLEWALIADGVSKEDVYDVLDTEEGVDRAFKKLDTIKDQVIWWTKGAQPVQLLADGEVVIASAYNGRLFNAIEAEKQPIAMMWDYQVFDMDGWVIPKGGPHREEVEKYLKFATDTKRLADQAKFIPYGPARASSVPLIGKHAELGIEMMPHMPTDPANAKTSMMTNYDWWADRNAELDERFNAWLTQ